MGRYCGTAKRDSGTTARRQRVQCARTSNGDQHPEYADNQARRRHRHAATAPAVVTRVVMAVNNSGFVKDGQRQPLTHGKIQLQS